MKFSHIAIACDEPLIVEQFYTKYFGFKRARVVPLGDGKQIVFVKSGNVYLEIFQATEKAPVPPAQKDGPMYPGWRHIAFQVDDVDSKLAEIGKAATVTLGPLSFDSFIPGWRTAWISDPAGNIVEISQGYIDQINPPALSVGEKNSKHPAGATIA